MVISRFRTESWNQKGNGPDEAPWELLLRVTPRRSTNHRNHRKTSNAVVIALDVKTAEAVVSHWVVCSSKCGISLGLSTNVALPVKRRGLILLSYFSKYTDNYKTLALPRLQGIRYGQEFEFLSLYHDSGGGARFIGRSITDCAIRRGGASVSNCQTWHCHLHANTIN